MKFFIRIVGLSLIPTLLMFIGRSDSFFTFLKDHSFIKQETKTDGYQLLIFVIGILWSGLVTPLQLANTKKKLEEKSSTLEDLLRFNKETYFKTVKADIKQHNINFRTRIFVKEKGIQAWWNKICNSKVKLTLRNFNGISDPINVKSLYFEAEPESQGLVGKAFNAKEINVDCDVQANDYNLTPYQKTKTNDVKFCSTAPILNTKNEVVAVLAIDSDQSFSLSDVETKTWKDHVIYYCAFVDKHLNV
jgi:hypothetical protein